MNPHVKLLTAEELREIEERCGKATEGPMVWQRRPLGIDLVSRSENEQVRGSVVLSCDSHFGQRNDTEFYKESRTDVPRLLAHIKALEEENKRYESALESAKTSLAYFVDLYGEDLGVINWHQNGDSEPFDNFLESADAHDCLVKVRNALYELKEEGTTTP